MVMVISDSGKVSEGVIYPMIVDIVINHTARREDAFNLYGTGIVPVATDRLLSEQPTPSYLMVHINNTQFGLSSS